MASLTQCTWVWVDSKSLWWTGIPGMLQSKGSQKVERDWVTELNWTELQPMDCSPPGSSVSSVHEIRRFPRQEYWSKYAFPSPGDTPSKSGIKSRSLHCRQILWHMSHQGNPLLMLSQSVQSCLTLCNPMDCSIPGFPVRHHLPELTQTNVHRISDAIQPSHPLSSPSPPAFNLSQHQGLS